MLTSSDYNYEFSNAIRNKRRNEKILSDKYIGGKYKLRNEICFYLDYYERR